MTKLKYAVNSFILTKKRFKRREMRKKTKKMRGGRDIVKGIGRAIDRPIGRVISKSIFQGLNEVKKKFSSVPSSMITSTDKSIKDIEEVITKLIPKYEYCLKLYEIFEKYFDKVTVEERNDKIYEVYNIIHRFILEYDDYKVDDEYNIIKSKLGKLGKKDITNDDLVYLKSMPENLKVILEKFKKYDQMLKGEIISGVEEMYNVIFENLKKQLDENEKNIETGLKNTESVLSNINFYIDKYQHEGKIDEKTTLTEYKITFEQNYMFFYSESLDKKLTLLKLIMNHLNSELNTDLEEYEKIKNDMDKGFKKIFEQFTNNFEVTNKKFLELVKENVTGSSLGVTISVDEEKEKSIKNEIFKIIDSDNKLIDIKTKLEGIDATQQTNKQKIINGMNAIIDFFKSFKIKNFERIISSEFQEPQFKPPSKAPPPPPVPAPAPVPNPVPALVHPLPVSVPSPPAPNLQPNSKHIFLPFLPTRPPLPKIKPINYIENNYLSEEYDKKTKINKLNELKKIIDSDFSQARTLILNIMDLEMDLKTFYPKKKVEFKPIGSEIYIPGTIIRQKENGKIRIQNDSNTGINSEQRKRHDVPLDRIRSINKESINKERDRLRGDLSNIKNELEKIKDLIINSKSEWFENLKNEYSKIFFLNMLNSHYDKNNNDSYINFTMNEMESVIKKNIDYLLSENKLLIQKYQRQRGISRVKHNNNRVELGDINTINENFGSIGKYNEEKENEIEYIENLFEEDDDSVKKEKINRISEIKKETEELIKKKSNNTNNFKDLSIKILNKLLKKIQAFEDKHSNDIVRLSKPDANIVVPSQNSSVPSNRPLNPVPRTFFSSMLNTLKTYVNPKTKRKGVNKPIDVTVRTDNKYKTFRCNHEKPNSKSIKFKLNGNWTYCVESTQAGGYRTKKHRRRR
jgi:hypothetical protein